MGVPMLGPLAASVAASAEIPVGVLAGGPTEPHVVVCEGSPADISTATSAVGSTESSVEASLAILSGTAAVTSTDPPTRSSRESSAEVTDESHVGVDVEMSTR
jgi:hypothetical protein